MYSITDVLKLGLNCVSLSLIECRYIYYSINQIISYDFYMEYVIKEQRSNIMT